MIIKSFVVKSWKWLLSLVFGVAVAIFWSVPYLSALSYQEQYQMFLFETDYFIDRIALPGGLADYVSEFLTQFYYLYAVGACILGLLLVGIQRIVWALMRQMGARHDFPGYLLSFIPSVALWCYMGDISVLLSFGVALWGALAMAWVHNRLHGRWTLMVYELVSMAVVYWCLGPVVLVYAALMAGNVVRRGMQERTGLSAAGHAAAVLVVAVAWMLLLTQGLQYPLYRIFSGLNYYRFPGVVPPLQIVVMVIFVIVPLLGWVTVKSQVLLKLQQSKVVAVLAYIVFALASVFGIKMSYDPVLYDMIDYEYLVRTEQWYKIIGKAEKKQPMSPMGVSCVNLALSQTGQLPDRLFEFFQNGTEGLFPTFVSNMTSPVSTAEVFYRLGMVNDAERYVFEAQEAIPNFRKSSRLTRRIIDCEVINGNYGVAAKLLRRVENTLFYRSWAKETMALLGNEKAISRHPVYGRLRSMREQKHDALFSDKEMDQMLGFLFLNNRKNKMAYEYLMCYELLKGDLEHFMEYYPLGKDVGYGHIPRSFQEILIGNWLKTHKDPRTIPYSVDAQTVNNTIGFIRTFMSNPNDPMLGMQPYVTNAWHYVLKTTQK